MALPSNQASLLSPGIVLGIALGGFFDGIMLHQVLQWHHLLSLVQGPSFQDIRVQILADGLFHVAVYLVALGGLWLLWRDRSAFDGSRRDMTLVAGLLLGFGIWQVADVVLFHWVARIHRIRVDVPNPLAWDIGWLVVLGLPPLLIGWWLLKRRSGPGGPRPTNGRLAAVALTLFVMLAGAAGAFPAGGTNLIVLFRPGTGPVQAMAAVTAIEGARILWSDSSGELLSLDIGERDLPWELYGQGALLITKAGSIPGCLPWLRP